MTELEELEKSKEYHDQLAQHHFDQYSYHEDKLAEIEAKIKLIEEQ